MLQESDRRFPTAWVVLLNWEGAPDTIACLDSLAKLDYPASRLLVVDNGSSDDSVERIKRSHPEVPVLAAEENRGFSAGNNLGLRHAISNGADYVWVLNNDTTVDPESLSQLVRLAERDPRVGAVGSVLFDMSRPDHVQVWGGGHVKMFSGRSVHRRRRGRLAYITGGSMLLRVEALQEVGLFDEGFFMYWEDADLCFRLRRAGWGLAVAEKSHVWHKESATARRRTRKQARDFNASAARFFQRHSCFPLVPVVLGVGLRMAKRLLLGQPGVAMSALAGATGACLRSGRARTTDASPR